MDKIPKLRKCINCGIGTDDGFPRNAHEENYCWICICRGRAIVEQPKKVYLVYYNGWDEYNPDLIVIKTTREKADTYIADAVANDTSLYGTIDNFHVNEWEIE